MKISLEWLGQYLPGPLTADAAAEALTHGGLPVEVIDTVQSAPGTADTVIDVEVTSNRSDCLSHVGVARELAALLAREFRDVPVAADFPPAAGDGLTALAIDAPDLCRTTRPGPSAASPSARAPTGSSGGCGPSACGRSTTWSTSPTTS